jgi:adenylate kinase family enzyme
MASHHLHITGAAGSGVTTLGAALADRLGITQLDTDDYYWMPPVSDYNLKRPIPDRLQMLGDEFARLDGWVLSGALESWGDPIMHLFDLTVFLQADTETRLGRLRKRETQRYGAENVAPGGARHQQVEDFVEWAAHYEDGTREGRTLKRHEDWMTKLACPVLRLDGTSPIKTLTDLVVDHLEGRLRS